MLKRAVKVRHTKWLLYFLFFLILSNLYSTKLLASTLFGDWYGLSHVNVSPLFLNDTPKVREYISPLDEISIFYSFEKKLDPMEQKPLSEGFTLFSTFLSFFKLSDVKYWHCGGHYDLWYQLVQMKFFNQPKSVNLNFGFGFGLSIESVSIALGNSKLLEDFDKFDFPHVNRVHLLNLLGRFAFSVDIPIETTIGSYLRYTIAYYTILTFFGPFADPLVIIEATNFDRFRTQWQHSIAFKVKF